MANSYSLHNRQSAFISDRALNLISIRQRLISHRFVHPRGAGVCRYQADEASRRSAPTSSGLTLTSFTRMMYERAGVLWIVNVTNPSAAAVAADVEFELTAMVTEYAHVSWVLPLPYDPANFTYTELSNGLHGVLSVGRESWRTPSTRPAAAAITITVEGGEGPDIYLPSSTDAVPRAVFHKLTVPPGGTRTIRVVMAVASNASGAVGLATSVGSTSSSFSKAWAECHDQWGAYVSPLIVHAENAAFKLCPRS